MPFYLRISWRIHTEMDLSNKIYTNYVIWILRWRTVGAYLRAKCPLFEELHSYSHDGGPEQRLTFFIKRVGAPLFHKLIKAIIYSTHCKILPTALEIIYQLFPINKGVCWSNKYKYPSLPMDLIWRYRSLISSFLVGIIVGPPVSIDWWYDMHKEKTFLTSIL